MTDIAKRLSPSSYQQKENRGNILGNSCVKIPILMEEFKLLLVIVRLIGNQQ